MKQRWSHKRRNKGDLKDEMKELHVKKFVGGK